MATLIAARELSKSFGSQTLFTGVAIQVGDGDRLGVIGPNGAGKSTLLRILAGLETADEGELTGRRGLRFAYVPQDDLFPDDATPIGAVSAALAVGSRGGDAERIDAETRAAITLTRLGFDDMDQPVATLSGGWRKRVTLACALVREPEILMLDEPTNHLDLEGVLWLERFVRQARMAVVCITHDRAFLEATSARILELSAAYPGGTFEVDGNYTEFVRRKEAFLDGQAVAESSLANKVRRDTAWLRQGIQGRQTRNKTQVDDTAARRAELDALARRNLAPTRTTAIDFQATERKTRKLLALHGVEKTLGGKTLFSNLDLELSPGRRIGLLGTNGSGKTTLLRLMAGEMEPDAGTIKPAADLRIITFAQHRCSLVPTQTLQEALCAVGDMVEYRGKSVHVTGWAKKFLFGPEQLSTFVGELSGGEQARVLIANLMLEPADILLLDEPTNDLDIPSLEVLEQALLEFPGAIVLVTHDRFMLRRLATEFLALDGKGGAKSFPSYEQWEATAMSASPRKSARTKAGRPAKSTDGPKKLTYRERLDLEGMEESILTAEAEVTRLQAETGAPAVVADHVRAAAVFRQLTAAQDRVRTLYERWTELESRRNA